MTPKYRADIDGLRAIAVLSIIFFHVGIPLFSGGYVGVDIFFVISGYLITTIIVREINNDTFSIAKFYERRFRRILPALVVVIFFSVLVGILLLNPAKLIELGKSLAATAIFSSNMLFYFQSGYFDGASELKPLLHTWSLAVEEQYYIFFPVFMILISKYFSGNYSKWLILIGLISFFAAIVGINIDVSGTFYLLPTRAWELFIGSILAITILPSLENQYMREILSITGLALIGFSVFIYTINTVFPGLSAVPPTIGSALIIYSGINGESFITRMLSFRPIVFIGLISYSLYLWHWPIIVYTKYYSIVDLTNTEIIVMLSVILILSIISWHYIEKPFRTKKVLPSKRDIIIVSVLLSFVIFCMGISLILNDGFPNRYKVEAVKNMARFDPEWMKWRTCEAKMNNTFRKEYLCDIGGNNKKYSFILWGDSHATALASAVDLSAKKYNIKGKIITKSACPPLLSIERENRSTCNKFNEATLKYISQSPEIKKVFLAARWALSTKGTRYKRESGKSVKLVDLLSPGQSSSTNIDLFEIGLRRTVAKLQDFGKLVVLVKPVPEIGYDVPAANYISVITGRDVNAIISPKINEFAARTKDVNNIFLRLKNREDIQIVDPSNYLCNDVHCRVVSEKKPLYCDDDHLSTYGSVYISEVFDVAFENLTHIKK